MHWGYGDVHRKKKVTKMYYLELLGCARYLAQQTGTFTGHSVVAVLTGQQKLMTPPLQPVISQVKTSSEQEGVTIDTVMEFNRKWKSVLLQQGKG
ncbi:protein SMG5 [Biomphalaria pfeifferi]|uniref:Protein SMG5 n=1 Tax=Biomphalaria pfeifferi TaxID=112525 RepID=A0AAD8FAP4_BIOPF|nr:protein SMG5 [Biomphalaria pfeifferi]